MQRVTTITATYRKLGCNSMAKEIMPLQVLGSMMENILPGAGPYGLKDTRFTPISVP